MLYMYGITNWSNKSYTRGGGGGEGVYVCCICEGVREWQCSPRVF